MEWEFEGMTVKPEGKDRQQTKWVIYRADGSKFGHAYSTQGVKRMISKANGTATCDCGHIPNDHSAAVPPSKRERWVDGRTKPTRPMKTAEHWQAVMRYCNTRYDKARMRVHRREKAWREQNPNWRDLMRDGKRPNFYDDAYHFWASLPYQFKKRFTEQVDVPGVRAGCFKCKSEGRVCMNSPAQARAAGKRRAKEAGLR